MSDSTKKQTFLHGAALLAMATAIVKVIGAIYKIPLRVIIGDEGYGYFSTAYQIYSTLLLVSTAGLPVAMSRMISNKSTLGHYNQVRRIYKTSQIIFVGLGIFSSLFMLFGSKWLATILEQPDAQAAIICLAPCALFMGIISTYRGFFQGQGDMRPTSNSQVLEAAFKLIIGLAAAFIIMKATQNLSLAAGGAILGVTASCLISSVYLYRKFRQSYRIMPITQEKVSGYKETAKNLLTIAIPITIGAAGLQLMSLVETGFYMNRLVYLVQTNQYVNSLKDILKEEILAANPLITAEELPYKITANIKGIYDFAQTIFNMPCAFIVPITVSVIPAITSQLTLKNDQGVCQTEESAARITGLISLPCSVGLCVLARPVMALLGGYTGAKLDLAASLMTVLGVCIFPYAIIQYTNAVMQAHGYAHIPVINMLLCGVAKLAVVYVLVGNPNIGILGAPIGALLAYGAIAVLNLLAIRKVVSQKPKMLSNLLRSFLPVALMGLAVYGCYWGLTRLLGEDSSRILLCGVPIVVGVAVYFLAVVKFKAITADDCKLLPKGERIAKLLKL